MDAHVGIVQTPCPELCCLGLDRGDVRGAERPVAAENTRIRAEMKKAPAQQKLSELADHVVEQMVEYDSSGFKILGIIGANRSPNCGVDTTSDNNEEIPGMGLFIEKIARRLQDRGISVPIIGLKGSDAVAQRLRQL